MGLRDRAHRLEKQMGLRGKDKPCPECGGRIVVVERHEEGATYPEGEPCSTCEGAPGKVSFIEVMLGGAANGD